MVEPEVLFVAPAQGSDNRCPEPLGGLQWQVLYKQGRSVAPNHRDFEQAGRGVPEALGHRPGAAHLVERDELFAVGEAIPVQPYARAVNVLCFRETFPFVRPNTDATRDAAPSPKRQGLAAPPFARLFGLPEGIW